MCLTNEVVEGRSPRDGPPAGARRVEIVPARQYPSREKRTVSHTARTFTNSDLVYILVGRGLIIIIITSLFITSLTMTSKFLPRRAMRHSTIQVNHRYALAAAQMSALVLLLFLQTLQFEVACYPWGRSRFSSSKCRNRSSNSWSEISGWFKTS